MRSTRCWVSGSESPAGLRARRRAPCHYAGQVSVTEPHKSFDSLFAELTDRARTRPPNSHTVARLDAGVHEIGKKIVEEAAEVWMAAEHEGPARTAAEISQLLYHLQVLMIATDVNLDDVYREL